MMRLLKWLFVLLLLAGVAGATLFLYAKKKFTEEYTLESAKEIVIPRGTGLNKTAQILADNGVIDDALWLMLFARVNKVENSFKAGEYAFDGRLSYEKIIEKLVKGDVIARVVTIPEGKALVEIKKIVNDNPYLSGEITLDIKEGEIMPETYHFTKGEQRDAILEKSRQAMKKTLAKAFAERDENLPIKSEQEMLVLASIVEKETGIADERGKVASVFVNRLRLGMKLQTDPTVIYAVTNGEMNLNRPLYKRDLSYDSPYNTYVYEGLPPAPICSPGKEAIEAVAHPDKTPYLYFVADGISGGHRFAKSLNEHNANVAHYRQQTR